MEKRGFVLIVEDEGDSRTTLVSSLASQGFAATGVRTIADAKRMLRRVVPEILLLDLGLPDGNGEDLVEQLRASSDPRLLRLPIVVLSGRSNARELAIGADIVLQKPVDLDLLVETLRAYAPGGERASA